MQGKVVLITGANGGLGVAVTEAFLKAGATVAASARSIKAADFPQPMFHAFPAELSGSAAANALVAAVLARLGRIDAVVHLMGGFAGGAPVQETDDATLEKMLDMNLRSSFHLFRAALPSMRAQGSGRIVAIGSRAAVEPSAGIAAYSLSKAALVSLIRNLALENKNSGVTANIILPGTMDTPTNRASMPGADFARWVQPEQVANLLLTLVADASSNISGAVIPIYGGDL